MTQILHIDSSARMDSSVTRQLSAYAVDLLIKENPSAKVIRRDLTGDPLPHIGADFLMGEASVLARSEKLIAELEQSDILVIGVPMYNFGVPTQLKAWIDHICRAGKTFSYTAEGPKGLLKNKRAIIAVGTGGAYSAPPMAAIDHVTPYLKQVLAFIGITDVEVVVAEKQAMGADVALQAMQTARGLLEKSLGNAA